MFLSLLNSFSESQGDFLMGTKLRIILQLKRKNNDSKEKVLLLQKQSNSKPSAFSWIPEASNNQF